jgi:chromosome segregation ATPase
MPKKKSTQKPEKNIVKDIEKLLGEQTTVILDAVDERLVGVDKRFDAVDKRLDGVDKRLYGVDKRFDFVDREINELDKKIEATRIELKSEINDLATALDAFLKKMTDVLDEFEIIKARVNKIEKILEEKLGVTITL